MTKRKPNQGARDAANGAHFGAALAAGGFEPVTALIGVYVQSQMKGGGALSAGKTGKKRSARGPGRRPPQSPHVICPRNHRVYSWERVECDDGSHEHKRWTCPMQVGSNGPHGWSDVIPPFRSGCFDSDRNRD